MASSTHNPAVLLKRILSLSEATPLLLCLDSIPQTANYLINEIVHHSRNTLNLETIFVAFETLNKPSYATHFIDINEVSGGLPKLIETLQSYLPSPQQKHSNKRLVIIDSLNYIPNDKLAQFISAVASPHCTLVGVYHKDTPEVDIPALDNYPSSLELLQFMATTILNITPALPSRIDEESLKYELEKYSIPRGLNNPIFNLKLINRRRSGRSLSYDFQIDTNKHLYEHVINNPEEQENEIETPEMLQGLTTFNLSTSTKQKMAKDQVALPFLEAQGLESHGGAIVYEYEKDDDYDEEDPYEDPF
ncbi:Elongator subunit IKI1 NDAI_0C03550 [Naumovozyma dairenensis CBS 421]|uniref:Elongator complex protein 5 n=1 Tax=Naumovozyma dairenensis (strain ATCC 10597 / BCRC 20456 / CBS 421 / NBRC 0211 / NRRL Y-12639) TaxID=1071378 RepID=G0W8A4_NAUDC|nr:hypothetical protein NDAI_0C03550 [Naumovozyma dairenensis CBS 421]CCD24015.1 hypothetical protein NDAI_0C03550 [Naumovozyma dairenensis CBS 421]